MSHDSADNALTELIRFNQLFDVYGEVLTRRQQMIARLRFERDLSLGEIAEEIGISRQAAHDAVKQARGRMEDLERRLGILDRRAREELRREERDRKLVELAGEARRRLKDEKALGERDRRWYDEALGKIIALAAAPDMADEQDSQGKE